MPGIDSAVPVTPVSAEVQRRVDTRHTSRCHTSPSGGEIRGHGGELDREPVRAQPHQLPRRRVRDPRGDVAVGADDPDAEPRPQGHGVPTGRREPGSSPEPPLRAGPGQRYQPGLARAHQLEIPVHDPGQQLGLRDLDGRRRPVVVRRADDAIGPVGVVEGVVGQGQGAHRPVGRGDLLLGDQEPAHGVEDQNRRGADPGHVATRGVGDQQQPVGRIGRTDPGASGGSDQVDLARSVLHHEAARRLDEGRRG